MRSFLLALWLAAPLVCAAQADLGPMPTTYPPATDGPGDVVVTLTPEISKLLNAYSEHKHPQKGYRVQIFLGDRATAEATKRAFLQKNPDVPAYLSWLAPNFRLRVGDLRTRLEAERLLRDLKTAYPGSYIVPDGIEMPPLPGNR
ncbi:MAG: SPOR domain-containing protein [Flavobacteriales bacterium]|nr:SPOR domain-containing protein [Flavobacteriales bacterium]